MSSTAHAGSILKNKEIQKPEPEQVTPAQPGKCYPNKMDEGNLLATLERSFELQIQLSEADSNEAKVQLMKDYIESAASNVLITLPEFNEG